MTFGGKAFINLLQRRQKERERKKAKNVSRRDNGILWIYNEISSCALMLLQTEAVGPCFWLFH